MTPQIRLLLACGLISAWMILLFTGNVFGGWTHLVLAVALYLFPWRGNRSDSSRSQKSNSDASGVS